MIPIEEVKLLLNTAYHKGFEIKLDKPLSQMFTSGKGEVKWIVSNVSDFKSDTTVREMMKLVYTKVFSSLFPDSKIIREFIPYGNKESLFEKKVEYGELLLGLKIHGYFKVDDISFDTDKLKEVGNKLFITIDDEDHLCMGDINSGFELSKLFRHIVAFTESEERTLYIADESEREILELVQKYHSHVEVVYVTEFDKSDDNYWEYSEDEDYLSGMKDLMFRCIIDSKDEKVTVPEEWKFDSEHEVDNKHLTDRLLQVAFIKSKEELKPHILLNEINKKNKDYDIASKLLGLYPYTL